MAKKPPLYPHVPKSRTKASSQVEVIETGDRDWYKPGIHLRNPSAAKVEDAKEEAINKGFDTVYAHRVAETTAQVTKTGDRDWVEEELPFAGATSTKVWWLATIRDKTYQVEVSGCSFPGVPVWKIEEAFANSVAKVSVPAQ